MCSKTDREQPGKSLHIGIIGCGQWGINYIRLFHHLPGAVVAGCCDISEDRRENVRREYPGVHVCREAGEILAQKGIDAVVVATTAATHFQLVRDSLRIGKHVLAEKPLTLAPSEALELHHLARASRSVLMVGHTFLYNPAVVRLRQLVNEDALGTIYYLSARRTHLGLVRKDVNAVWDLSPHDVSIFNFVLNALPTQVSAVGSSFLSENSEDFAFISLTYPRGIVGHIFVSWVDSNKTREIVIVGSRSRIVFDDLNHLERLKIFHKGISIDRPYSSFGEFQLLLRDGSIVSPRIDMEEPLKVLCREFLRCVMEKSRPVSDALCGWEVVKIVHSIDRSIKSNGLPVQVSWDDHPCPPSPGAGH